MINAPIPTNHHRSIPLTMHPANSEPHGEFVNVNPTAPGPPGSTSAPLGTVPIQSSAMAPAAPTLWERIKDALAKFWAWLFPSSSAVSKGVQGVGFVPSSNAFGPLSYEQGWTLTDMSTGQSVQLTDIEGRAASDGAQRVILPPPVFHPGVAHTEQHRAASPVCELANGAGIGITLSRAQTTAACAAINALNAAHAGMVGALETTVTRIPYQGGYVDVDHARWQEALDCNLRDVGVGETSDARIDAALSILAIASDPESVAEVGQDAAAGDVNASLIAKALVDAAREEEDAIAYALACGICSRDDNAITLTQGYCREAQAGDETASAICAGVAGYLYQAA